MMAHPEPNSSTGAPPPAATFAALELVTLARKLRSEAVYVTKSAADAYTHGAELLEARARELQAVRS